MDVKTEKAPMVAALLAVLWAFGAPAAVEASLDAPSSRVFKTDDSFAMAPRLDLPSLTQQLRAVEERRAAAAECVALCELAAGIDAHPFGVASAELPNRSEDAWGNYRFTTELAPSKNRFGFTGHYWDNEAGLYYANARFYDPFTARFTQADSFLGNIDDPPSLHRYSYANDNPTMYVDPTGHIVDKIVDNSIRQNEYTGRYASSVFGMAFNAYNAFGAQTVYEVSNFLSVFTLKRQDKLVDQNLAGKITDEQYFRRTKINAASGGVIAAAAILTGGTAAAAFDAAATASGIAAGDALFAATAAAGGGFGALGAQTASDLIELSGTRTKGIDEVSAMDYLGAFAFGAVTGPGFAAIGNPTFGGRGLPGSGVPSSAGGSGPTRVFYGTPKGDLILGPAELPVNAAGGNVVVPRGHVVSPLDPPLNAQPISVRGPFTDAQRAAFLRGSPGDTRLAPHHRGQVPVQHGGVIDELPGPGNSAGNAHTGQPRHPNPSTFNRLKGGNSLRSSETRGAWQDKGQRLVEVSPGVWVDPSGK